MAVRPASGTSRLACRRLRLALSAALLLVTLTAGMARGQTADDSGGERLALDAPAQWAYAEGLLAEGEYYRATTEYLRLRHFFPEHPRASAARLRLAEAHLRGGEAHRAVDRLEGAEDAPEMRDWQAEALYLRGLARLEVDAHRPYPAREPHIAAALEDLRAVPPAWPGKPSLEGFVEAMENPPELPGKSPWLAGSLSAVLPGAGSAYVGRYREAGLAFFVNAVFIWATVEAFQQDRQALGTVLGVGALAFYGGAIYAAANGAHKYNDRARAAYLAEQRRRFGLSLQPGGLLAAYTERF